MQRTPENLIRKEYNMQASCFIDSGFLFDCANIKQGGLNKFVILYNQDDWELATLTEGSDGEITDIVNSTGLKGYRFDVADESALIPTLSEEMPDGGIPGYRFSLNLSIVATSQAAKNQVDRMKINNVVAVYYKNDGTGEVLGRQQGLKLTENNYNPQDPSTGNVIPIVLATPPNAPLELRMQTTIDAGTPATTKALIEGLVNAGA
jgi:hypothetical protein